MTEATATAAARDVHTDADMATQVHLTQELGLDPTGQPSPTVAAVSSFVTFSVGAVIPLIPYLLGFVSLAAGRLAGASGLLAAGAIASLFTVQPWWRNAIRQLLFGAIAAGATHVVGVLIGVGVPTEKAPIAAPGPPHPRPRHRPAATSILSVPAPTSSGPPHLDHRPHQLLKTYFVNCPRRGRPVGAFHTARFVPQLVDLCQARRAVGSRTFATDRPLPRRRPYVHIGR